MLASWKARPRSQARSSAASSSRIDAHHDRHHAADRAGDMIAIAQQVGLAARAEAGRVEREAGDQIARQVRAGCAHSATTTPSASNAGSPVGSPASAASVRARIVGEPRLRDRRRRTARGHAPARRPDRRTRGTRRRAAMPARASADRTACSPSRSSSSPCAMLSRAAATSAARSRRHSSSRRMLDDRRGPARYAAIRAEQRIERVRDDQDAAMLRRAGSRSPPSSRSKAISPS